MDRGAETSEVPKREELLLSVAMIVRNEAEKLPRALTSVRNFADETVVVDTGSEDDTSEIAAAYGARVFSFPWRENFADARNASLERCKGRWILVLDADEWLTPESGPALRKLLQQEEQTPCCEAYQVRIVNLVADAAGEPRRLVHYAARLFRNNPAYRFTGRVHEQILPSILEHAPSRRFPVVGTAPIDLLHDGYASAAKNKVMRNLKLLEREWAESPANPFTAYNLGVEYLRLGDADRAAEFLERSISLSPPRMAYLPLAYRYLALAHAAKGDLVGALKAATRGTETFPESPDLWHLKGDLAWQAKDVHEARQAYLAAYALGEPPPGYPHEEGLGTYRTAFALGRLSEEGGNAESAVLWYLRALRHRSNDVQVLAALLQLVARTWGEEALPRFVLTHLRAQDESAREFLVRLLELLGYVRQAQALRLELRSTEAGETKASKGSEGGAP
ncbi:tetratricopeptide repeat-containing glycosyltransferase family 2 protein [Brockia lithotrophica]|uniref:Tetratricopeptide repeat protein n=1 Tax=Brockia lithotrophica TaxID=933949 RepID=A0A660L4F6_9BACL|nr:TPR domain-containing glycosyltransferase [Brockia lithotrophica]RKQ88827.1 tetratricopeptide repeat protein [Brockia lithotrophica]